MSKKYLKKAQNDYNSSNRNLTFDFSEIESMISSNSVAWKIIYKKVVRYYKSDLQIVCNLINNYNNREKQQFNCYYCYSPLELKSFTLDHFYPKFDEKNEGLRLNFELMQSCQTCNASKKDHTPDYLKNIILNNLEKNKRTREFAEIFLPKVGLALYLKVFNVSSSEFRDHHNDLCKKFISRYG